MFKINLFHENIEQKFYWYINMLRSNGLTYKFWTEVYSQKCVFFMRTDKLL